MYGNAGSLDGVGNWVYEPTSVMLALCIRS